MRGHDSLSAGPLDGGARCSLYVLMQVESLGEALTAGWRVHARCLGGVVDYTRSRAKCHYQGELSIETLDTPASKSSRISPRRDERFITAA